MKADVRWDGNGTYSFEQPLPTGKALRLEAQYVRRERTGLHARLSILYGTTELAWSNFNLEKDEERVRLSNSAHSHLGAGNGQEPIYPKAHLKHDVDRFCRALEEALLDSIVVEHMAGDKSPTAPIFVLAPFILEGGGTILYGPPGRGKSWQALLMAVSVDAGRNALYQVTLPRKVLFINLERSAASMSRRLGMVNRVLELDPERPLLFLNARGRSLADLADRIRRAVKDHQVKVIFLDSISRAGVGDLTENGPVNRITDLLNSLAETWFALGHTPRGDETHIYGSIHFEAAADVMVQLVSRQEPGGELGVGLEVTKGNDINTKQPMTLFGLAFDPELGLTAVRKAKQHEFSDLIGAQKIPPALQIEQYLVRVGWSSPPRIASQTGLDRTLVAQVCQSDKRFISKVENREVLYSVASEELF